MRRAAWGVLIAAAYVVIAAVSFQAGLFPARPLYDGTAPPEPYRWVNPPPDQADGNEPPASLREVFTVDEAREGAGLNTDDRQVFVVIEPDQLDLPEGITGVEVVIEPLDPDTFGDPPEGLGYDGNAYRIEARYQPSGEVATLTKPVTILLRYAFGATTMLRRDGEVWTELAGSPGSAVELLAESDRFGVFVPAGLPRHAAGAGVADWIYAVAGLLVVIVGVALGRFRAIRKREEERLRQMGKKAKRSPGSPRSRGRTKD